MTKRASKLRARKSSTTLPRKQAKKFYQTPDWRATRAKLKKKRRKQHEEIVLDVYRSNPDNNPQDLIAFLDSDMPLCEWNLKKGIIKVSKVLDHKKRIRAGGAKFKESNLQFVTEQYHNSKSGKEAHE